MREDRAAFFELSLDLLCIAGREGRFLDLNAAWTRTLGWSLDELTSRPFVDFVHPDDRQATVKETARLSSGLVTVRFENRYSHKDGTWRWLQWTAKYRADRGVIYAIARDVTREKTALLALRERIEELERLDADLGRRALGGTPAAAVSQRLLGLRARLSAIQEDLVA